MYIFVCLKSQRCSNHSHIRQNSSVFVSLLCFQLITQASRQKTYEQAVQIYLCQWLGHICREKQFELGLNYNVNSGGGGIFIYIHIFMFYPFQFNKAVLLKITKFGSCVILYKFAHRASQNFVISNLRLF